MCFNRSFTILKNIIDTLRQYSLLVRATSFYKKNETIIIPGTRNVEVQKIHKLFRTFHVKDR